MSCKTKKTGSIPLMLSVASMKTGFGQIAHFESFKNGVRQRVNVQRTTGAEDSANWRWCAPTACAVSVVRLTGERHSMDGKGAHLRRKPNANSDLNEENWTTTHIISFHGLQVWAAQGLVCFKALQLQFSSYKRLGILKVSRVKLSSGWRDRV